MLPNLLDCCKPTDWGVISWWMVAADVATPEANPSVFKLLSRAKYKSGFSKVPRFLTSTLMAPFKYAVLSLDVTASRSGSLSQQVWNWQVPETPWHLHCLCKASRNVCVTQQINDWWLELYWLRENQSDLTWRPAWLLWSMIADLVHLRYARSLWSDSINRRFDITELASSRRSLSNLLALVNIFWSSASTKTLTKALANAKLALQTNDTARIAFG